MPVISMTDSAVRGFLPGKNKAGDVAPAEYRDSKVPGLSLVVGTKTKTWFATNRSPDGRRKRVKLGKYPATSLADARERALSVQHDFYSDVDPAAKRKERRRSPVFEALARECLEDKAARGGLTGKTRQSYESLLRTEILPRHGQTNVEDLSRADAAAVINSIRARGKVYLANRALELLRSIFRWAMEQGVMAADPTAGLKPGKEYARDRALSDAELSALWSALDGISDQARDCYRLLLLTGQREMEVVGMQWPEIDLDKALWTLPAQAEGRSKKRERAHVVPLSPAAVGILRSAREARPHGVAVFQTVKRNGTATTARRGLISGWKPELDKVLDFAEPWRIHDLRRTVRSGLSLLSVPPHIAELVIGHAVGGLIKVYDQYDYVAEKRDALNRWASHLLRVVGEAQGSDNVLVAMPGAKR